MPTSADREVPKKYRRLLKRLSAYRPDGGSPEIVPLDYPSAELCLYVTSKVELRSKAISCRKEPWTVEWLDREAQPGNVVFDVGANVGAYALIAGHRVGQSGRVIAIEPGYASYARLCDNVVLNDLGAIIMPVALPVGASTEISTFNYHRLQPGCARHVAGPPSVDGKGQDPVYAQPVMLVRLDDLIGSFGLPEPHLMKIDVDGTEESVLLGASRVLRGSRLRGMLIEIDEENTDTVLRIAGEAGFRLTERHQRTRDDGALAPFWYGIFSRP